MTAARGACATFATLQPVRGVVLVFLLVVLPFQFAWGAAAAFCGHETAAGAGHFGHHSHQHPAKAMAESDSGSSVKKASVPAEDPDCGVCHLSCVQPPSSQDTSIVVILPAALVLPTILPATPGRPGRIERPKWSCVA